MNGFLFAFVRFFSFVLFHFTFPPASPFSFIVFIISCFIQSSHQCTSSACVFSYDRFRNKIVPFFYRWLWILITKWNEMEWKMKERTSTAGEYEHDCCNNFNKISNWIQFENMRSTSEYVRFITTILYYRNGCLHVRQVRTFKTHASTLFFNHTNTEEKKQHKIIKRLLTQACNLERVMNWKLEWSNNSKNKMKQV